jgi:hypothetical protein
MDSRSVAIPVDEIEFHPHSFADVDGRLFTRRGELFRGISRNRSHFYTQLFETGLIRKLVAMGLLVDSEISSESSEEYELLVRHRKLPFISYPNEWPAPMLKDAALLFLDLLIELTPHGLTLKDGHPWNILFDGPRPVYVDLTSIIQSESNTGPALDEFSRFCLYPLFVMANGHERIARCLISEYEGVLRSEAMALSRVRSIPTRFVLNRLKGKASRILSSLLPKIHQDESNSLSFLRSLRKDVESLEIPTEPVGWTLEEGSETNRNGRLSKLLSRVNPSSVLAVGNVAASETYCIANGRRRVVSLETNSLKAARLYNNARTNDLPILSLVMDFVKPTPSIGYSNHYSIAANERLKCDLVYAPSLVDALVRKNYLRFEIIAEGLSLFSKRWLLVGFPRPDSNWSRDTRIGFSWYTFDNFVDSLKKYFRTIESVSPDGESTVLLLCEKKRGS